MDRHGMQGLAIFIFLSFSALYLLNSRSEVIGGGSQLESLASGVERVRLATISREDLLRRRLLQSDDSGYIGYGALTGDNVPCPPQSGRSYYTPNCQSATGPVNPYTRGCSTLTRCARG